VPRGDVTSDMPDKRPNYPVFVWSELERAKAILRLTIYL